MAHWRKEQTHGFGHAKPYSQAEIDELNGNINDLRRQLEVNQRIALARAKAVKELLMKKYGIGSERILAEGQGVGNMFSEADWSRVSICTIEEAN